MASRAGTRRTLKADRSASRKPGTLPTAARAGRAQAARAAGGDLRADPRQQRAGVRAVGLALRAGALRLHRESDLARAHRHARHLHEGALPAGAGEGAADPVGVDRRLRGRRHQGQAHGRDGTYAGNAPRQRLLIVTAAAVANAASMPSTDPPRLPLGVRCRDTGGRDRAVPPGVIAVASIHKTAPPSHTGRRRRGRRPPVGLL
jgi:hypothetical protein